MSDITIPQAKKIVRAKLKELELDYTKLTGETVHILRDSCVFITIHGWEPDPLAAELKELAVQNGFRVQFRGPNVIAS
jgi:hypothetical protein